MGNRLSKIFTRTGDEGETGLGDGSRIAKDHPRVEALGAIDELNSMLGLMRTYQLPETIQEMMAQIQHDLFNLGGELCIPGHQIISLDDVARLEQEISAINSSLPPLKEFILPGGTASAAVCHVARAICRRAERRVVTVKKIEEINAAGVVYLNRLSDLLFVVARLLIKEEGGQEVLWQSQRLKNST